jgi:FMNH2-dependent dimethyl sulfone monooxygenase
VDFHGDFYRIHDFTLTRAGVRGSPITLETRRKIVAKADRPAVEGFRAAVQHAGNSTADKRECGLTRRSRTWFQYNDGFRMCVIGTPEQIAERIAAYRKRGVDLILDGFTTSRRRSSISVRACGPLVREIEQSEQESVAAPLLASP